MEGYLLVLTKHDSEHANQTSKILKKGLGVFLAALGGLGDLVILCPQCLVVRACT